MTILVAILMLSVMLGAIVGISMCAMAYMLRALGCSLVRHRREELFRVFRDAAFSCFILASFSLSVLILEQVGPTPHLFFWMWTILNALLIVRSLAFCFRAANIFLLSVGEPE